MPPALVVLPNDIPVDLGPGRHPDLPKIYRTETHPLWNKSYGNIYYFIQDLSKEGMMKSNELEKTLRIPQGPESKATKKGGHHILAVLDKLQILPRISKINGGRCCLRTRL
jgi:hypothetical protein